MLKDFRAALFRGVGSIASQSRGGRKLSILIYHRVLAEPDPLRPGEIDQNVFRAQVEVLAELFNVIPLSKAVERLKEGQLPPRAVSITFDDGYADNEKIALPILQKQGLSATFFLATGYLDGGRMWNDSVIEAIRIAADGVLDLTEEKLGKFDLRDVKSRLHARSALISKLKYLPVPERGQLTERVVDVIGKLLPDDLMMTSDQVKRLASGGMELGAHTVGHPILMALPDGDAHREISQSRAEVERIAGSPVALFAYPNGQPGVDYSCRDTSIVRKLGFAAAVSTAWGVSVPGADCFQLPRFTPWDRNKRRFALRLLQNYGRTSPRVV